MKVKIVKTVYDDGGDKDERLKQWIAALRERGYDGPANQKAAQDWMATNYPEDVIEYMNQNPPSRNTNKGKRLFGKDFSSYTDKQKLEAFQDGLWDYRNPTPGKTGMLPTPKFKEEQEANPEYNDLSGSDFSLKDTGGKKDKYKKKGLPFYQAAPELAGFVSALNTYNYYTPDYTHQEIRPQTLNIQPQLQSIDSSLNAVNQTTTGSPQIDNIRKSAAFTQALQAKQQAFGNKQNYDAQGRLQADQFNIGARNQEQNMDVYGVNQVYNNLIPLAKDYAAGERIAAMSSLSNKEAKNRQNENMKSLYLDNFWQNYQVDENGNFVFTGSDAFTYDKYSTDENSTTEDTGAGNGFDINAGRKPYEYGKSPFKKSEEEFSINTEIVTPGENFNINGRNKPYEYGKSPFTLPPTNNQIPSNTPLLDFEWDPLLEDPIRNQRTPRNAFKKGGKKKKKTNNYY